VTQQHIAGTILPKAAAVWAATAKQIQSRLECLARLARSNPTQDATHDYFGPRLNRLEFASMSSDLYHD
jgi:hypothetical protein